MGDVSPSGRLSQSRGRHGRREIHARVLAFAAVGVVDAGPSRASSVSTTTEFTATTTQSTISTTSTETTPDHISGLGMSLGEVNYNVTTNLTTGYIGFDPRASTRSVPPGSRSAEIGVGYQQVALIYDMEWHTDGAS
ncbi:kinesin family member 11 [Fusarium albosuccineum]|uniref:Kinesin family member 11 n=1 Tax=Fusarium albosuccineum TaxID=1237068 RepID=A0A8H4L7U3_9HYPO|nr:kinesin family member 11 [Fusarium albosuccineum]